MMMRSMGGVKPLESRDPPMALAGEPKLLALRVNHRTVVVVHVSWEGVLYSTSKR